MSKQVFKNATGLASELGVYRNFSGYVYVRNGAGDVIADGYVERATFEILDYAPFSDTPEFCTRTIFFKRGTWCGGTWYGGHWLGGEWKGGTWYMGYDWDGELIERWGNYGDPSTWKHKRQIKRRH